MGAMSSPAGALTRTWGKISYGFLFVAVLPLGALLWARATEQVVPLPSFHEPLLGNGLLVAGAWMIAVAMRALWVRGGGLPMSPFPPPRRVEDGIYGWVRHPIYLGTSAIALGASLREGSASGLWLVTPALTLGCIALVWGYERWDLLQRFGPPHRTWLSFPQTTAAKTSTGERLTVLLVVVGPILLATKLLDVLPRAPLSGLSWPEPWLAMVQASPLLLISIAVALIRPAAALRRFATRSALALSLALGACLAIPGAAFGRGDWVATLLVAWSWMLPGWPARLWALAVSIAWGPVIAAGGLVLAIVARPEWLWAAIRRAAESVANSLHTWTLGPVRILSGAAITFLSGLCMLVPASVLTGP
ncbi:MAG TPA: methyltransferase, partial [Myxococcaceae bacterium]|nr:methyltransferase [Myxococcaceae bacterium]